MRTGTCTLRKGHDGPELVDPFRKSYFSFGTGCDFVSLLVHQSAQLLCIFLFGSSTTLAVTVCPSITVEAEMANGHIITTCDIQTKPIEQGPHRDPLFVTPRLFLFPVVITGVVW